MPKELISIVVAALACAILASPCHADQTNACDLVKKSDVYALLGKVDPMKETDSTNAPRHYPKGLSQCQFQDPTNNTLPEINISVEFWPPAIPETPAMARKFLDEDSSTPYKELSGIGDVAFWASYPGICNQACELIVYQGNMALHILLQKMPDEASALAGAKQLAAEALATIGETGHIKGLATTETATLTKPEAPPLSAAHPGELDKLRQDVSVKANAGDARAQYTLGLFYQYLTIGSDGHLSPDYAGAAYWYREAANRGDPDAMYALAQLYKSGKGVAKDEAITLSLLEKAANLNHVPSMAMLGETYFARGTWVGAQRALPWLKKAGDAGNVEAMVDTGWIYNKGVGVFTDYNKAMEWYMKGAAKGDCTAIMNIGGLYYNGDGVTQNREEAKQWFAKAASCKDAATLGIKDKAARFLKKTESGNLPAVQNSGPTLGTMWSGLSDNEKKVTIVAGIFAIGRAREIAHGPYTKQELADARAEHDQSAADFNNFMQANAARASCLFINNGDESSCPY